MKFPFTDRVNGHRMGVVTAVLVALPTLGVGFFFDDYLHFATMEGHNDLTTPYDLYVFSNGDANDAGAHVKRGPYPWYMDPEFKAHFFRPLACVLMVWDHWLFGHFSPGYNAHSILWYALLAAGCMVLLRRTLPLHTGVLALFIFVLDEAHVLPVAWWSNRHAVMAVSFGFLGMAAHLRWRENHWKPGLSLSLLCYVLSLLSSETGLCVLAYIPAYEALGANGSFRERFRCVLPATFLALAYFIFYRASGYGAQYSDIYIDPGANPITFSLVAPQRFLMLAGSQFLMFPCEMAILAPFLEPYIAAIGLLSLFIIAWALYRIWPLLDERENRTLRWIIPGAALAALPGLAALVSARTLLAASLGGSVILAVIIVHAWKENSPSIPRSLRILMWIFIGLHLFAAALSWPLQTVILRLASDKMNVLVRDTDLEDSRIAASQVVLFSAPDPYTGLYPLMLRCFDGKALPRSWWTLSLAPFTHRLTRTAELEMEMEIVNGQMFTSVFERLFRSKDRKLTPGYNVDLDGLVVSVMDCKDVGPTRLHLLFDETPESDRYQLLVFRQGAYHRIAPPSIGTSLELPYGFP